MNNNGHPTTYSTLTKPQKLNLIKVVKATYPDVKFREIYNDIYQGWIVGGRLKGICFNLNLLINNK